MSLHRISGVVARPLHRILLAFPISFFSMALITDIAYLRSAEMQWTNFSAWLIAAALVFGGLAGVFSIIDIILGLRRGKPQLRLIHTGALVIAWILGLINAFKHSQDAWSSVGGFGVTLSFLCVVLVLIAGWIAYTDREIVR